MNNIQIETGEKHIAINGDPDRVIVFNPSDVVFAERFYRLMDEFQGKLIEYRDRSADLEKSKDVDEHGVPLNIGVRLHLATELCEYIRVEIDKVFGAGTSQKAFGDYYVLDAVKQFFNGLTPHIQRARSAKTEKYTGKKARR